MAKKASGYKAPPALPTTTRAFMVHRVVMLVRQGVPWPKALTWTIHAARSPFMGDAAMIALTRDLEREARGLMRQRRQTTGADRAVRAAALLADVQEALARAEQGTEEWTAIGVPEDTDHVGHRRWQQRAREAYYGRGLGGASQRAKPVPRREPEVIAARVVPKPKPVTLAPADHAEIEPMPALADLTVPIAADREGFAREWAGVEALAARVNGRRL